MPLSERLRRLFHDPNTPGHRWLELAVWVLILVSIGLTTLEVATVLEPWQQRLLSRVDRVVLALFALEYVLRVATWRPPELDLFRLNHAQRLRVGLWGRVRFAMSPLMLVDLAALFALHPALRSLRALRVLRLMRGVRLFRYANPFAEIGAAVQDNALLYLFAFGILVVETIVGGVTMYLIEGPRNDAVNSVWDGMWWTVVTLTTVGYGDITPVDALGRGWAAVLMVAGMFTLALFAGVVGHTLLHTVLTIREEQFRMTRFQDHVVVVGYTPGARMLLDALADELSESHREVVLFGPGERSADIPTSFRWVAGDPQKESELDKVHLTHADTLLLVGDRRLPPQQADAATILTVFTARRYLRRKQTGAPRQRPVRVVAEVLESENADHARTAGADEVIESTRVGFAMLAHTLTQAGTASIMSRVVSQGAHSVYVGSGAPWAGQTAGAVAHALKGEHGALLLGLRDAHGDEILNPDDDLVLSPDHALLYLHTSPVLDRPPEG